MSAHTRHTPAHGRYSQACKVYPPGHPERERLRAALRTEQAQQAIREIADADPPLTAADLADLAGVLLQRAQAVAS